MRPHASRPDTDDSSTKLTFKEVTDPQDPDLQLFSDLMRSTFADPNLILSRAQLALMMAERDDGGRRLHLVLLKLGNEVAGGSLFSYIPATNFGFSEYIVLSPRQRGRKLARRIFDHRLDVLHRDAREHGHRRAAGLFIEVANPNRVSPQFKEAERRMGVDTDQRWRIMHHFGYRRVDLLYIQPPIAAGKEMVLYLDLLLLPLDPALDAAGSIGAPAVLDTLGPVWRAWAPATHAEYLDRLAQMLGGREIPLLPMIPEEAS